MPKERIRDRDSIVPWIEVRWGNGADVQLASVAPDEVKLIPTPEGNGWYVTLGRYQINELIRCLRKARDRTYGKDE